MLLQNVRNCREFKMNNKYFGIRRRTLLAHALQRIAALDFWNSGIDTTGNAYLSKYDEDLFIKK